ncbi:amidohydrolase family protein [Exilibacterium tricleocarpae]|uniref:Amidohydrolase family protein n=1 Tax=Exilibacterium tricleocarpae TaxID=2591008 RepID=A0A545U4E7_9GAMM|nr:amidohydrolase family protein [Exilibacterium tricleocarpae]
MKVALGSDAGSQSWDLSQAGEFQPLQTHAGMPAMEAIQSGTHVATSLLGQEEKLGSIRPGMLADIVAIKGDPLQDIGALTNFDFVMKNGVEISLH